MEKNDMFQFTCSAIDDGEFLIEYTGRGENISPEFKIDNLAENAKTILITLEDLSHSIKDFTHWVIWNIPAEPVIPSGIPAGKVIASPNGACQGVAYGNHRYAGPKPPKGKRTIIASPFMFLMMLSMRLHHHVRKKFLLQHRVIFCSKDQ